ncbi:MAG: OstA-like protein [Bacteroidales bacterium]
MSRFFTGISLQRILVIVFICLLHSASAQKTARVNLVSANTMEFNKDMGADLRRVLGNVVFEHEGATLFCDSAWFFEEKNQVKAFGHIRIKVSDTLNIYGNNLNYDGNTKIADLTGKVKMVDKQTTLLTERLNYDRNTGIASYNTGATITGDENTLKSKTGYYYTANKQFFFKDSVVLLNPRYTMKSDTLLYHTLTRVSDFKGPTRIFSKENFIYCENGWYNTIKDIAQFQQNSYIKSEGQLLKGDSLYYDRVNGIGRAFENVYLFDSVKNIIVTGHYGDYRKKAGYAVVTDSVLGMLIEKQDTLYMHSDTLFATFDTANVTKTLSAYHKVKFFRHDLQGLCDSLKYNVQDSTITLFHLPVLWTEENQLTSDSIRLWITNNKPDSMMLYNSAFISSREDTLKFNQIKGRNMTGYFRDSQLEKVRVEGNAKTVYFAVEDDGTSIGVNIAAASDMLISLKEKKVNTIKYLNKPDATLFPEKDVKQEDIILPGFKWYEKRRPANRHQVFIW